MQREELVDVVHGGGTTSCDAERAGRALELVLGLHQSHRVGGARVRFQLQDRGFGVDTRSGWVRRAEAVAPCGPEWPATSNHDRRVG